MTPTHNISEWIPQRPPFVFIDTIVEMSTTNAVTQFTVPKENPLVEDGRLTLAGLIENSAQTCAARAGWVQRQQQLEVKIGYIGAIKQMDVTCFPSVGQTLTTEANVVQEVMNICMMEVKTFLGNKQIASTIIKLATIN